MTWGIGLNHGSAEGTRDGRVSDPGQLASSGQICCQPHPPSDPKASISVGLLRSRQRYNLKIVLKYSIVVPFHNEEQNVTELYDRLKVVMEATGEPFELVFVDDGSRDHTFSMLQQIAAVDRRVVVVKLRRNFGQTSALAAGFDHAKASS